MSKILIASPALSDAATLTTNNELGTLPATNLQKMQPTKVYRTNSLDAIYMEMDLGSISPFNLVAMLYTNASSTATWQVRAANTQADLTAAPGYDSGILTHWASPGISDWDRTHAMLSTGQQSYQWIRIDIVDPANPDGYYQAGRIYISDAIIPSVNISLGWSLGWEDDSTTQDSLGGKTFVIPRQKRRLLNFSLDFLTEIEMNNDSFSLDRLRGKSKDIFVIKDIDDLSLRHSQSVCGLMKDLSPIIKSKFNIYRKRYAIRELL